MMEVFSAMEPMAATVSFTARPLSSASLAPCTAICSICRPWPRFWVMLAVICSRLEVVSSKPLACSLLPWARF